MNSDFTSGLALRASAVSNEDQLIWMTGVNCTGSEDSLSECYHSGWGNTNYCDKQTLSGVVCFEEDGKGYCLRLAPNIAIK